MENATTADVAPKPNPQPPASPNGGLLEFSETFGQIAAGLAAAQAEFPELVADSEGAIEGESKASGRAFSFSYEYASLGAVLATFRPVLAKYGIAVLQPTAHAPEQGAITVKVQTWLVHKSGEWIRTRPSTVFAPGGDMKKVGGAITYARRYQLGALLGVAPEEDTDDGGGQRKENVRRAPAGAGNFTCSHGHRHPSAAEAKGCSAQEQASPTDRTLEPGEDPPAMKSGNGDLAAKVRAAIAAKDWRTVVTTLGQIPESATKRDLQAAYNAARYGQKEQRA